VLTALAQHTWHEASTWIGCAQQALLDARGSSMMPHVHYRMIRAERAAWLAWLVSVLSACSPSSGSDSDGSAAHAQAPQTATKPGAAPSGPAVKTPAPTDAKPAAPAAPPEEAVFRRSRTMMGTIIAITIVGVPDAKAAPAADAALDEMEQLEKVLSEWLPDSEISKINAAAGKGAVKVGPDTLAVVRAGLAVSKWSHGAYDLSWAALRGMYKFQPGEETIPDPKELRAKLPLIDYRKIKLDEKASTVQLLKKGMVIGTGSIAKGYALDRASAVIEQAGIQNYMIFGGGQVQVHGQRNGRAWRVGIQHPRHDDYFAFVAASNGSISTSGDYEHYFMKDGKRWHHIIDTDTGLPVAHTASVTVIAANGLYADAMSTAVFVLGAKKALPILAKAPVETAAVIVDADMTLHVSDNIQDKLVMHTQLLDGKLPE
jgi:thiamine biosynthesis lipoprotein